MELRDSQYNAVHFTNEISGKDLVVKIKRWCVYIRSKSMVVLLFGTVGALLGLTYAWFKAPVYTAVTTFVLEEGDKSSGIGQYAGLASIVGIDLGGGGGIFQGDNILELYKSRRMIERTLLTTVVYKNKKQLLIDVYVDINNLRSRWDKEELGALRFDVDGAVANTRMKDSILHQIVVDISKNYLYVSKPDKKLSIIRTEVRSSNEYFSKLFNQKIVENVNEFYVHTKTKKALENVRILQHNTDSVRTVMNGAIYGAAAVTDATPNLNPTRQIQRTAPVQKSIFTAEANKAILSELLKNLELSKISLRKETPLIQIIDEPSIPLEKSEASKFKSALVGLFLFSFIAVCIMTVMKIYRTAMLN